MFILKKIARYLFITLLGTVGSGSALSSCSSDDEPVDETETESVIEFEFQLYTGSTSATRATTTTTYSQEDGTADENYINLNNIHLYLYQPSTSAAGGKAWGYEMIPTVKQVVSADEGKYYVKGVIPEAKLKSYGNKFVLAVTANWPKTPYYSGYMMNLGLQNADDYTYDYGYDSEGNPTYYDPSVTPIPMFGLKYVSDYTQLDDINRTYQLGVIYMDRALAKVIVNDMKGDKITDVTLTKCMNRGMCAPWGLYQDIDEITQDYVTIPGDVTSGYKDAINGAGYTYPSALGFIENLPFKKVADNKFMVYVPEFRNIVTKNPAWGTTDVYYDPGYYTGGNTLHEGTTAMTITYKCTNDNGVEETREQTLEFKDSDDNGRQTGDLYNLIRNHVYTYNVDFGDRIKIFYVVESWNEYTAGTIEYE